MNAEQTKTRMEEAKQSCAGYVAEQGKLERELGEIIENEESIRMELEVSENLEKELNLRIEELHALLEKERDTESEQLKISEESHLSLAGMEQQNLFVSENISRIEEEIVKFQAELEELDKNKDHASDEIKEKEDKIKELRGTIDNSRELFDEIEKAHPDVMNILLQILDEGKINDAQGRTVDFSNTVICMTSNAGSTDQSGATGFGKKAEVASADRSMKALQEFLRPEFIGRVDEIITFKPLSEEDLEKIAALMLDEYKPGLAAHGITLHYDQPALADIVAESSAKYGARELRRTIRKTIEDPISDALVDGRLNGSEVTLALVDRDGKAVLDI